MVYHGASKKYRGDRNRFNNTPDEIVVSQQHCGGENLVVFKDLLLPNRNCSFTCILSIMLMLCLEKFAFDSRRHQDYPFALALYINGLIDSRISVCCEYRHRNHIRLGGKYGSFAIDEIRKVKPCEQ